MVTTNDFPRGETDPPGTPPQIKTRASLIHLRPEGIIHVTCFPGIRYTLEDAKANQQATMTLSGGKPVAVLVDIGKVKSATREARAYYSTDKEARQSVLAMALLIHSSFSRIIGNFMIGINRPPCPTRLFSTEAEAIQWLIPFVNWP